MDNLDTLRAANNAQAKNSLNQDKSKGSLSRELSYNSFFGLDETPFSISPNPRFLYMSQQHQEALAHLLYGIQAPNGFVLLTGEVGTGKTTVIRAFLQHLPDDARVAYILHAKLSARELLETIADELNVDIGINTSQRLLVNAIHKKLLEHHSAGFRTFLLIDEAQNLSASVLEEIRLLTNLETDEGKLLHIILVGQPELKAIFQAVELRQLNQRITARFHLSRLVFDDVALYVQHRLAISGATRNPFQPQAMKSIARYAKGVPRLINIIADRALLAGFAKNQPDIDRKIVKAAAQEVLGERPLWRPALFDWLKPKSDLTTAGTNSLGLGSKIVVTVLVLGIIGLLGGPVVQELTKDVAKETVKETTKENSQGLAANTDKTKIIDKTTNVDESALSTVDEAQVSSETGPLTDKEFDALVSLLKPEPQALLTAKAQFNKSLVTALGLWPAPITTDERSAVERDGCDGLPGDLSCLQVNSSLQQLVQYDVPFIVNLKPDQLLALGMPAQVVRWFLVSQVASGNDDKSTLSLEGVAGQTVLLQKEFQEVFDGRAVLMLQSPVTVMPQDGVIRSEHARWVLERTGFSDGTELNPVMDFIIADQTYNLAVQAFQQKNGLGSDGLFGLETLIALNRTLNPQFPRLTTSKKAINL